MIRSKTLFAAASLCALLAGCVATGKEDMDVIGTGRGIDDYKVSPCACSEVPQAKPDQHDFNAIQEWLTS